MSQELRQVVDNISEHMERFHEMLEARGREMEISGGDPIHLPRPTINLFSGGLHAGGQVAIQDVLVVPASAKSIDEALAYTYAIFQAGASLAFDRYGYRLLRADEGGMAPDFSSADDMLSMAVQAIEKAGLRPGEDVFLAVDVSVHYL